MKKKEVAFAVAQAAVVVAVLALVSLPLESPNVASPRGQVTSTGSEPYQVVKDNVTVPGSMMVALGCEIPPGVPCAVYGPEMNQTIQLPGASLIDYQGSYYYHYNGVVLDTPVWNYTVWFTNSTIYCVTPHHFVDPEEPVCPA